MTVQACAANTPHADRRVEDDWLAVVLRRPHAPNVRHLMGHFPGSKWAQTIFYSRHGALARYKVVIATNGRVRPDLNLFDNEPPELWRQ